MDWLGWLIVIVPIAAVLWVAFRTRRYIRDIADYLAAGRVAGRYVISVGDLQAGLGVITLVAMVEEQYQSGLGLGFWSGLMVPISLVMSLTGYVVYRFRQTRVLSIGQFLEIRYSRRLRIVAASIRTLAEMLANAIGPAVAARFFIYLLGFPHSLHIGGMAIPTFAFVMAIVILLALCIIWPGGRVSLIVTDCLQSLMSYPIFVIFTVFVLTKFSFVGEIAPSMLDRAPGESFLNPHDLASLRDFNLFALFVNIFGSVLNRGAWIGNDSSTCARTPHEQKMAGILGTWRNGFAMVMCMLISVSVYATLNHARFSDEARKVRTTLVSTVAGDVIADNQQLQDKVSAAAAALPAPAHQIGVDAPLSRTHNPDTLYLDAVRQELPVGTEGNVIFSKFRTLYYQMMLPAMARETFPLALMGLFCLLMVMLMITTDSGRIFNASSTIVQDVIMPLRGKPFDKEQHFKVLRLCTLGVCIFFFTFSLFLSQLDYINMFLTATTALWLGAAGPIMIFGLYSRFGNTAGAWASLVFGSGTAVGSFILQQCWPGYVYPWLDQMHWVGPVDGFLRSFTAYTAPYVVWEMSPVKFPINPREYYFIAMLGGIAAYVLFSILSRQPKFNLDQLLHRGQYAVASDTVAEEEKFRWTPRQIYNKMVGITPEYTRGDKIITWSVLAYSLGYQFLICFVGINVYNMIWPVSNKGWTYYFYINAVALPCAIGVISTVWFTIGGAIDLRRLFKDLEARTGNLADDGWVEGHVSLADKSVVPVTVTLEEEAKAKEGKDEEDAEGVVK